MSWMTWSTPLLPCRLPVGRLLGKKVLVYAWLALALLAGVHFSVLSETGYYVS